MRKIGILMGILFVLIASFFLFGELKALISDLLFPVSNGGDSGIAGEADMPGDLVLTYQPSAKDTLVRSATAAPTTASVLQTFDVQLDIPATEAESVVGNSVSYNFSVKNTGRNLQDKIVVSATSDLTTLWDWTLLKGDSPSPKVLKDRARQSMFRRLFQLKNQSSETGSVAGTPQTFEVNLESGASESFTLKVVVSKVVQVRPFVNFLSVRNQAGKGTDDDWGVGKDSYSIEIKTSSVPGPPATIDTTVEPQTIVADGTSSSTITAAIKDRYGNSILPTTVAWSINPSEMGILATSFSTTVDGVATNSLTSIKRKQGSALVSASVVRPIEKPIVGSASIFFTPDPNEVLVVEAPTENGQKGPSVFVPVGALPAGVVLDVREPGKQNGSVFLPEDVLVKLDEANFNAGKGIPEDLILLDIPNTIWQFSAWKNGERYTGNFEKPLQIRVPYPDEDGDGVVDGTEQRAEWLKIFWLNEKKQPAEWEAIPSEVIASRKYVQVWVSHFSVYSLQGIKPPKQVPDDLKYVTVYPNPFILGNGELTFINLPEPDQIEFIRIYNLAGELVKEIKDSEFGTIGNRYRGYSATWDGTTKRGRKVASGIYLYVVKSKNSDKPKIGKIGVVK